MGMRTGIKSLDDALAIDSGIITIRSRQRGLLDQICREILCRNLQYGKKVLVLHFSDYHDRYWSINIDALARLAGRSGTCMDTLLDSVYYLRIFCRDGAEREENWKKAREAGGLGLVILDSVSDLYKKRQAKPAHMKPMLYMIANFARICAENSCIGVALDYSQREIHSYLGEISSIVIGIRKENEISFEVQKHPMMPEMTKTVWKGTSLRRWM